MSKAKSTNLLKNRHRFKMILLLVSLVLAGIGFIILRLNLFWGEKNPSDFEDWKISYSVRFFPGKEGSKIKVVLPYQTGQYEIISESLSYSNLDIEIRTIPEPGRRELVGTPRNPDRRVTFSAHLYFRVPGSLPETELTSRQIKRFFPEFDMRRVFTVSNVKKLRTSVWASKRIPPLHVASPGENQGFLVTIMDLTRLSPRMEDVLVILLLMPLGALITSIFHNVIRFKTFSHFTPTLLAISFMRSRFLPGLIIFSAIFLVGFSLRHFVHSLKLTLRPRVSLVFLFICMALALTVSLSDYVGASPGSGGVLLPMIALTLLIERYFRNTVKRGYPAASKKLMGTMVAAIVSLVIFQVEELHWVLLNFPEVEFFIAALLMLIGLRRAKAKDANGE